MVLESESDSKTNRAAIVTNTTGQQSSNSTLLGGTAGRNPAPKSAPHSYKAFYGQVRSVHSELMPVVEERSGAGQH